MGNAGHCELMAALAHQREDYAAASARHLRSAKLLLDSHRFDCAVHLAGFAVECALKCWLSGALSTGAGAGGVAGMAILTHDLTRLAGGDLAWVGAVLASSTLASWIGQLELKPISRSHPERRYWPDQWTQADAAACIDLARRLLDEAVLGPMLDDHDRSDPRWH